MKYILSLLLFCVVFSSCYTTHKNAMINEPAFEKAGQVQASATAGINHVQGQVAASFSDHVGVLGGVYRGITGRKNITVYEYGLNLYTPISSSSANTVSFTLGGTIGNHKSRSGVPLIDRHIYATTNSQYTGNYLQMAYVHRGVLFKNSFKTAFVLKTEMLNFSSYDVIFDHGHAKSQSNHRARQIAKNRTAFQFRPAVVHYIQKDGSMFFGQIQYGLNLMRGFKISESEPVEGYSYTGGNFDLFNHPQVFPLFINIAMGIKIK